MNQDEKSKAIAILLAAATFGKERGIDHEYEQLKKLIQSSQSQTIAKVLGMVNNQLYKSEDPEKTIALLGLKEAVEKEFGGK